MPYSTLSSFHTACLISSTRRNKLWQKLLMFILSFLTSSSPSPFYPLSIVGRGPSVLFLFFVNHLSPQCCLGLSEFQVTRRLFHFDRARCVLLCLCVLFIGHWPFFIAVFLGGGAGDQSLIIGIGVSTQRQLCYRKRSSNLCWLFPTWIKAGGKVIAWIIIHHHIQIHIYIYPLRLL